MIKYFASAFRNLQIALFAIKNQNLGLAHLLSRCKVSSEFWKEVLSWLKENNIVIDSFNEIGLFLGIFEESEDFLFINHVMLKGKYIYAKKCLGSLPSLRGLLPG